MNRIEGWRELEKATGVKEHYLRRLIGVYGFPKPIAEPCFQRVGETKYKRSLTNVWFEPEVRLWLNQNSNTIPTNHTIQTTKGDGYGNEQDQCNGDGREPRGDREESPGLRR